MRCEKSKYTTVKALQSIGYDTIASGDSHNDLGMIQASKAGFLFKSTDAIKAEYPDIPAYETYDELFAGPSKAGKSWLTLWLCLQVAQGKPMWGREIEPHTVLYLSLGGHLQPPAKAPSPACGQRRRPPNGWSCRRNAAASGRGWKNSSPASSISTRTPG